MLFDSGFPINYRYGKVFGLRVDGGEDQKGSHLPAGIVKISQFGIRMPAVNGLPRINMVLTTNVSIDARNVSKSCNTFVMRSH